MDPLNPKVEGKCDKCGDKLVIRKDDTKEVIETRMKEYNDKTAPLLDAYEKRKIKRIDFEPKRGVNDYPKFKGIVEPIINKI